jgi:hypothetical protein
VRLNQLYKHFIAGALLILYGFIVTPTQWLHEHDVEYAGKKVLVEKGFSLISDLQGFDSFADECRICSHKYSSYTNEFQVPIQSIVFNLGQKHSTYIFQILPDPLLLLSNKSPPPSI